MTEEVESQRYRLVESVLTDGDIPVELYVNDVTGLRVVVAKVECPIVKGDMVFATEAFDDDGLPHTLEHLVFLGSEDYPYKGVLDLLANKCLADGTNAYTDTDHTNYTFSTAGSDGFLTLLPIYLEHLLFSTLTDEAYTTEVHHINSEGEDAGVVYCEMQARENTGDERCSTEMLRELYPPECGYRSNTGGAIKNLRESTNNKKVRDYHIEFYHTKNLCLVVTGPVEAQEIFKAIKPVEDKVEKRGKHKMDFKQPWQTPVPVMEQSTLKTVLYACDTEDDGLVYVGFRGPNVVHDFEEFLAVTVVMDYLNSTSIAPIQRDFVECEDPWCSSVSHNIIENSTSCLYFSFESVNTGKLAEVMQKFILLLRKISEDNIEGAEKFDMDRLQTIISHKIVRILSVAEVSPHSIVIGPVIGHFLYGINKLEDRCQQIPILEKFKMHSSSYWKGLIQKYMCGPEARYSVIQGKPSPEEAKKFASDEKMRVDAQKERLKDELPRLAEELEKAFTASSRQAPQSMLNSIPKPSIDNIKFHQIERRVLDEKDIPFRFHYDSIKTNFISMGVFMDTSTLLSQEQRLYLPLISEMILESPQWRDGELIPHEKIVAEIFSDTVSADAGIGISSSGPHSVGAFGMLFGLMLQVELQKYERGVKWCHDILFKTKFTPERIKTIATRMSKDISQHKRSGSKLTYSLMNAQIYQSNSNQWATNFMRQQKFLRKLLKNLEVNADAVEQSMTEILRLICRPENVLVHLSLDKNRIEVDGIHKPWLRFIPEEVLASSPKEHLKLERILPCHKLFEPIDEPKAAIIGSSSVESNFLQQIVKSVNTPKHPDIAAIYVIIQYLSQLEGPLFRQVRGLGLSYHCSINLSPADGTMNFLLYKATQLVEAYAKSKEVVLKHVNCEEDFDDNLLEAAKSSLVFEFIKREKSAAGRSLQSLLAYLRDLDIDFNKDLIKRISQVTRDDLIRTGKLYLKPLFEDPERRTAICCHTKKVDEIVKGLREHGCHAKPISLEEEKFLNSIESS